MSTKVLAAARRVAAALLLAAGSLPASLELRGHRATAPDPVVHVESSTTQHHADHCVMSGAPYDPATPVLVVPHVGHCRSAAATPPHVAKRIPRQGAWLTTRSRAPPSFTA